MASRGLNKVMIIGNLGRDPEVKYLPSGRAVANFSVATNERYQDKDGNWQDSTEWHRVVFFGKTAETVGQYLSKGSSVYIEGRLKTRSWEQDGQKRYMTEIEGRQMIMLGGRGGQGEGSDQEPTHEPTHESKPSDDEDIPF